MSENPNNYPPYTPIASLGRELGIMFAFIGACLVTMVVYSFAWRAHQTRTKTADLTRRKAFQNRASITNPHYLAARTAVTSITTGSSAGSGSEPVFAGGGENVVLNVEENGFARGGRGNGNGLVELPVHGVDYGIGVQRGDFGERRELL